MSSARRVAELDAWTKAGQWQASVGASLFGCDVHGKTLGIVGMGNIGAAVARRGRFGFNMPIIYSGNSRKTELEQELGAQFRSLDQWLAEAERHSGEHFPWPGGRRASLDRSVAEQPHTRRRPTLSQKSHQHQILDNVGMSVQG